MEFRAGAHIWIPCEVKPGPFSDERLVRVQSDRGEWLGFVNLRSLKDPIPEGRTQILALVEEVHNGEFSARLPGEALRPALFKGPTSKVQPVGPFQT